jgi:hypothetical protein
LDIISDAAFGAFGVALGTLPDWLPALLLAVTAVVDTMAHEAR